MSKKHYTFFVFFFCLFLLLLSESSPLHIRWYANAISHFHEALFKFFHTSLFLFFKPHPLYWSNFKFTDSSPASNLLLSLSSEFFIWVLFFFFFYFRIPIWFFLTFQSLHWYSLFDKTVSSYFPLFFRPGLLECFQHIFNRCIAVCVC